MQPHTQGAPSARPTGPRHGPVVVWFAAYLKVRIYTRKWYTPAIFLFALFRPNPGGGVYVWCPHGLGHHSGSNRQQAASMAVLGKLLAGRLVCRTRPGPRPASPCVCRTRPGPSFVGSAEGSLHYGGPNVCVCQIYDVCVFSVGLVNPPASRSLH